MDNGLGNQNNFNVLNLNEQFPKPPFYYKQENLNPPIIEDIAQMINPEFFSFGQKNKVISYFV